MTNQLLFYKKAVPISNEAHRKTAIRSDGSYGFAREVNSVPLVAAEFRPMAGDGTIVFAGSGEAVVPVVILGLTQSENLFIDEDGQWTGRYIPAFIRRYPFVFAASADGKNLTLCIDEAYEGLNQNGEGEHLFDSRGERTSYLEGVLTFARDYQAQFVRTQAFCKRLMELDLLEPMHAEFRTSGGKTGRLNGFLAVNRDKLKALPDETLGQMARSDELELLYVHLQSLQNLQTLLNRIVEVPAEEQPEAEPVA
ncbi:SapC family protein [Pseudooceanicola nanhaiensis]|uniref:SapC family protein n=1 Tax=Pseudooceanicola nanhaiensis TaxID=375761 RepID=UPI001CD4D141|nr:SapC family protein [Pseudooceanicola nanhaiensis]MCA0921681.1 SapC family protein [Pseudooceanicola nanhaiensis]